MQEHKSNEYDDQTENEHILTGKQAYEARKAEKKTAKAVTDVKNERKKGSKRGVLYAVIGMMIAALIYGAVEIAKSTAPSFEDFSLAVPDMGREHIAVGAEHAPYNSNPPTSGPHYEVPARAGFRDQKIEDEHIVHSLEHGLIWISYHPGVFGAVERTLRDIADGFVVVTEREANDTDMALAAWGRLDKFNLEEGALTEDLIERIRDFIKRYKNRGPERIPAGQHGGI